MLWNDFKPKRTYLYMAVVSAAVRFQYSTQGLNYINKHLATTKHQDLARTAEGSANLLASECRHREGLQCCKENRYGKPY